MKRWLPEVPKLVACGGVIGLQAGNLNTPWLFGVAAVMYAVGVAWQIRTERAVRERREVLKRDEREQMEALRVKAEQAQADTKRTAVQTMLREFPRRAFDETAEVVAAHLCCTVLTPTAEGDEIVPQYRFSPDDGVEKKCSSYAGFQRGTALAGMAWNDKERLRRYAGGTIGPFATDEQFREFYHSTFKMPDHLIDRLSERMRRVRDIACWGMIDRRSGAFVGVLSVDSTQEDALAPLTTEEGIKKVDEFCKDITPLLVALPEGGSG